MPRRPTIHAPEPQQWFLCSVADCPRKFRTISGRTRHINAKHDENDPRHENSGPQIPPKHPQARVNPPLSHDDPNLLDIGMSNSLHLGDSDGDSDPHFRELTPLSIDPGDIDMPGPPNPLVSPTPSSPSPSSETGEDSIRVPDVEYHPYIDGAYFLPFRLIASNIFYQAQPCDEDGILLLNPKVPPITQMRQQDDWTPYRDRVAFELADFLFQREQMSVGNIDILLHLWAASLAQHDDSPPFLNHQDLYDTIDATPIGGVPWQSASLSYDGPLPIQPFPWMQSKYTIWFRDPRLLFKGMLENPDFAKSFDYRPYRQYDTRGSRRYEHFMSADWAWSQAVCPFPCFFAPALMNAQDIIAEDPENHGAMFVPIILGSDKTTVSVMTGQTEYWPIYGSIGNIHNNVRRAHGAGLVLIGFLSIPKSKSQLPFFYNIIL
jgi:Plavaka transposase